MNQGNYLVRLKNLITQTNKILNRWKDYFGTILNLDTDDSLSNHRTQLTLCDNQTDGEVPPPSHNEVCSIINKLKSNKAGGTDNIIPKLVKQGGRSMKQRIYKLILRIWEKGRNNLSVYKRGDRTGLHEL